MERSTGLFSVIQRSKHPLVWDVYRRNDMTKRTIRVVDRPNTAIKRLAFPTLSIGSITQSNLIYTTSLSCSQRVAGELADRLLPVENNDRSKEIVEELRTIDPKYSAYLARGIFVFDPNLPGRLLDGGAKLFDEKAIHFFLSHQSVREVQTSESLRNVFVRNVTRHFRHIDMQSTKYSVYCIDFSDGLMGIK